MYEDLHAFMKDIGLEYQDIHACPNDDILYYKEYALKKNAQNVMIVDIKPIKQQKRCLSRFFVIFP